VKIILFSPLLSILNLNTSKTKSNMTIENLDSSLLLVTFLECLLLGIVAYAIYVAFGPPAQDLRDPFEEHED
jgi:PsbN protein